MLPKCNGGADVQHLSAKLRVHEAEAGLPDGGIAHHADHHRNRPAACFRGATYAGASPRLAGLTWGAEDLSAAIGARSTRDDAGHYTDVFRFARTMTLLASSAAEVAAIDTVFVDFRDADGLTRRVPGGRARRLHRQAGDPSRTGGDHQRGIHAVPKSVEQARGVVAAFEAAGNPGVVCIDGQMYDVPHLKRAQRLLARAEPGERPDRLPPDCLALPGTGIVGIERIDVRTRAFGRDAGIGADVDEAGDALVRRKAEQCAAFLRRRNTSW